MVTGQEYSLVASDLLMFNYGMNSQEVEQFSTDANNDTALYLVNGQVMCRELLTMQYSIDGSSQVYNTTRIYVPDNVVASTGCVLLREPICGLRSCSTGSGITRAQDSLSIRPSLHPTRYLHRPGRALLGKA